MEALVNTSLDGVIVVDSEGRTVFHNERATELWKMPPDVARGRDLARVLYATNVVDEPELFAEKVMHLYHTPLKPARTRSG